MNEWFAQGVPARERIWQKNPKSASKQGVMILTRPDRLMDRWEEVLTGRMQSEDSCTSVKTGLIQGWPTDIGNP